MIERMTVSVSQTRRGVRRADGAESYVEGANLYAPKPEYGCTGWDERQSRPCGMPSHSIASVLFGRQDAKLPEVYFWSIAGFRSSGCSTCPRSRFRATLRVAEHTSTLGDHPFGRLVVLQVGIHSVERHRKRA